MSYVYSQLGTGQIRLLILHPGAFDDDISISLCTHHLGDSGTKEPYEAVSYVWGSSDFTKSIQCDEHELLVTESVETLLRHLRFVDVPRRLWIDGICINQLDLVERSSQVLMMKKIFSGPSRVLIWMGPEDDNTIPAIQQFMKWGAKGSNIECHNCSSNLSWCYIFREEVDVVRRFTDRPWFHRVWTFQEVCLSPSADIICGRFRLPWMCVLEAASRLMSMSMLQNVFGRAADSMAALVLFSPSIKQSERPAPELLELLRLGRNREATDDRDKVFGILGLLHADVKAAIVPDYSMDTTELYIHCARTILMSSGNLGLLTSCLGPVQRLNLPSWVPDWRVRRRTAVLRGFDWGVEKPEIYHINGTEACDSSSATVLSGMTLHQRGAYLGTVTSTHSPVAFLQALEKSSSQYYYLTGLDKRWNIFAPEFRKLLESLSLAELYHQTGESAQMALLRTLSANRLPEAKVMRDFVVEAAKAAHESLLCMVVSIYRHMIEQHSDPAQLLSVKSIVKQLEDDDQSLDYGSILAFGNEYLDRTPSIRLRRFTGPPRISKKVDSIPPEWVTTLLAIHARQKDSVGKAAESSGEDSNLQDIQDFLAVCDLAWSILDYPLYTFGGASARAMPAQQRLFYSSKSVNVIDKMGSNMLTFSSSRVVFKTGNGLIGLGPDYMSEGDEVWDLVGGDVPFLLRQGTLDSTHGRHYRLVGECYVHGIMGGELWEDESNQSATSTLRGKDLKFEKIRIV